MGSVIEFGAVPDNADQAPHGGTLSELLVQDGSPKSPKSDWDHDDEWDDESDWDDEDDEDDEDAEYDDEDYEDDW